MLLFQKKKMILKNPFIDYIGAYNGQFTAKAPEGRPGMSDVYPLSGISGRSFDSTLLSPLLFFCLVLLPFLSYRFLPAGPFFSTFFQKIVQYFSLRDRLFLYGSCLAVRRRQLVGGMCSMLPFDTGMCCYAFISHF